jgi:hypothetical protein
MLLGRFRINTDEKGFLDLPRFFFDFKHSEIGKETADRLRDALYFFLR